MQDTFQLSLNPVLKPAHCLLCGCVISPHMHTALSPLTGDLLKSEIREFVA